MPDLFWIAEMQKYVELYSLFHKAILAVEPRTDSETLLHLWNDFRESVCDCEGCREDSNCVLHIDVEDFDSFDDEDSDEDSD